MCGEGEWISYQHPPFGRLGSVAGVEGVEVLMGGECERDLLRESGLEKAGEG